MTTCRSITSRIMAWTLIALTLAGSYAAGLGIRRMILQTQVASIGQEMPFTLESALHYRRIKILHDRGFLPEVDVAIQHPEGIRIREIDAVSSEPVQVFLARLFPDALSFPDRIRWIEAGWFCLGIPLLIVAMRRWTGSWVAGFFSGMLYAVSIASVLRSTGQEISRENFAFPWLMATFVFTAAYYRAERGRALWAIAAAAALSLALVGWDMVQYVMGLIALAMSIRLIAGVRDPDKVSAYIFRWMALGILVTGLLNSYHRFHGLSFSPMMIWLAGISLASMLQPRIARSSRARLKMALLIFGPVGAILLLGLTGAYGSSYEHFAELLWAKIKFLNQKPEDPSLLTYYQRVMWVPALHSATWGLTKWMFPLLLWAVLLIAVVAWFDSLKRPDPLTSFWVLFLVVSVIAYVFFVRFHVFTALACSVMAGWWYGRISRTSFVWRFAGGLLLACVLLAEARHTFSQKENMGRPNVYYDELKELADWLREHVAPEPVLANMGVSAYIAAYGKCAIAIHPKFEDPVIRLRLREYAEANFGDDEKRLRDWMDTIDTTYLVYSKGEFASAHPELQMRYFVDRMNPPPSSPARRFERDDESMRYFKRLWGNRKYVVYQSLSAAQEAVAADEANRAMMALQEGRLGEAENRAIAALAIDRHQDAALKVMRHVGSLIEQGMKAAP